MLLKKTGKNFNKFIFYCNFVEFSLITQLRIDTGVAKRIRRYNYRNGQSFPSAKSLIGNLVEKGILSEITGSRRGKKYVLSKYINIFLK